MRFLSFRLPVLIAVCALCALPTGASAATCARNITADVVAIDQVFFWNRLGAVQPQGQMFALRRDVVPIGGNTSPVRDASQVKLYEPPTLGGLSPGNVQLRPGKRPRPLVLRMNVGDCLTINFQNLLASTKTDQEQSATRKASIHAVGMQLVNSISDDGSSVGENGTVLVNPGGIAVYTLYAEREGEHVLYSAGATTGGEGDGGQINSGLFGAVIVEPAGSYWYRSQVAEEDLRLATPGTTATGYPIVNYNARYPVGHARASLPILQMLDGTEIVHSDLTAVITGSGANNGGQFGASEFSVNPAYPNRREPFREFVTIYHDETGAVQAFPQFEQGALAHTLHSGRDAFAINYGSAGVGAEVLANRLKVGPSHNCPECKFEEFFLSSWAVGDPAMVVDVPANSPCMVGVAADPNATGADASLDSKVQGLRAGTNCVPATGPKAQKAFFPDDPSNVYHGYMRDHTKFRVLHAGAKEHHIHHLHAHQWLYSPDNDRSSYLDSQALGPGSSFTADIAYEGGGNLNQTVGDSIFHCHFYPHFAQGMWALWRVHDVLEKGTVLLADGKPAAGSRALPDGEIDAGTPIPAVVPLPGKPMAPLPGRAWVNNGQPRFDDTGSNPGYPFFIPAKAGNRPPHPPLDTIDDGGLPRHRIDRSFDLPLFSEAHTRFDFHKELLVIKVEKLAETGTPVELKAMAFHATREHPTCRPDGVCDGTTPVRFLANGLPPVAGAPFADPCYGSQGVNRRYRAAAIQTDVKINKAGWHFPQQRFFALWNDVQDFLTPGGKPPEPLFFRANSGECIEYQFTNLVPHEYKQDDFQVRTPTDVLGQHIHLVKFDVLASDGAGNGFNYEDGSFSPGEVQERIRAIRAANNCVANDSRDGNNVTCPLLKAHPFFGPGLDEDGDGVGDWMGAQTTVQRWKADPVLDNTGKDRTLRTVFTHDHFGPSTHQQAGLYGGLVVEPAGSVWLDHEKAGELGVPGGLPTDCLPGGGRCDGGPTSWQAVIDPPPGTPAFREFLLAFNDFQPAYPQEASTKPKAWPALAINPPGKREIGLPDLLARPYPESCPRGGSAPCPELVSADDSGTMAVNYRNEPVALRVYDPATLGQAAGLAGDLSAVFSSQVVRKDARLNTQPAFYQPLTTDLMPGDPYTPLLRAFENDRVQIRILVGGHEEGHNFSIQGIKWRQEPSNLESGWRNSQMMGISEHYEFIVPKRTQEPADADTIDRLWSAGSSTDDYWNGIWGIFRTYMENDAAATNLRALPPDPEDPSDTGTAAAVDISCPTDAATRTFNVSAVTAQSLASYGSKLTYNSRVDGAFGALFDSAPILYVRDGDLDLTGTVPQLKTGVPVEPLVLRARAGECVVVNLTNRMGSVNGFSGYNTLPMLVDGFNANDLKPSKYVGLHSQLLHYDVSRHDGAWVGDNGALADHLAAPGQTITYRWYAGHVKVHKDETVTVIPIEFGATNLISSDRILHASRGAFGALIIEPADATWNETAASRAMAKVTSASTPGGFFRELVLQFQNDVNLRMGDGNGTPVPNLAGIEDPEDSGQKAINYRTEPLWKRMQHAADLPAEDTRDIADWDNAVANGQVGGTDPQTPVYKVTAGEPVRFRLLQAGGHTRNIVFGLHGHVWDRQPYVANSNRLGQNGFSFVEGARMGHGPDQSRRPPAEARCRRGVRGPRRLSLPRPRRPRLRRRPVGNPAGPAVVI